MRSASLTATRLSKARERERFSPCKPWLPPSNAAIEMSERTAAYLAAGAREVWLVREDGSAELFDASGPIAASSFGVALASPR
jgi:hypothetical protein